MTTAAIPPRPQVRRQRFQEDVRVFPCPLPHEGIYTEFLGGQRADRVAVCRFVDCETWRKEQMLDALVPTWEYKEGKELMNYYTQYYHKTDKVKQA